MKKILLIFSGLVAFSNLGALAQQTASPYNGNKRFEQLGTDLPTPNSYRTASGAPGKDYFQQRADYDIKVELDDIQRKITGSETITYFNNSPDELRYLWLQLDQNLFKEDAIGNTTKTGGLGPQASTAQFKNLTDPKKYGYNITSVRDAKGGNLPYTINNTMMRIDLPTPLKSGASVSFSIDWNYLITEYYGRSGYEYFAKDGNCNYFIAHWFPRMAVYNDVYGWQHKQFLGQGEFTLNFGNYKVAITAPNDHVVGASGELQNPTQVLSAEQLKRMEKAKTATRPVLIVSQEEAEAAEKGKPTGKKTWVYKADNVRDFAFASSRKFIWDAMQVDVEGKKVWAMSLYPKEGNPLWGQYSTMVVAHTLRSYSKHSVAYPYPVAYSCHATSGGGMEYPMISFNGGRPEPDGTYSEATKAGMIGVIIHEVGHNFFPMIINSDERQWSWMDEGLNTFCQYLAEQEWDRDFPSRRGEPQYIVPYMKTDPTQQVPIMSGSDNIMAFGPNAYAKPATALNILRETVMGRELFDAAFKEYARRWAFKQPYPADFFRTMEDASGVDLDWFWRGWFYGVEPVDQSIETVEWFGIDNQSPEQKNAKAKTEAEAKRQTMSNIRNKKDITQTVVEANPDMRDFYNSYDRYATSEADKKRFEQATAGLSDEEKQLVNGNKNFYVVNLKNKGGLPMPVIIKMVFEDGTDEVVRIPAEIWRLNDKDVKKVIPTDKKVAKWVLDPFYEIADINTEDNAFPREPEQPTRFQVFKGQRPSMPNPMQQQKQAAGAVQGAKK
ncbi:M1 family metallopeptidase [Flectobacillus sp. BAB-3569]|uniref:M1 family metallopeptidase n=1 Tax=Flectobacillus sp. BAB-3569 TaxID=1509483 RepID=UPI000BA42197|nr:M1 family metallopeptidase [Flectobacillus sp. BAB-3569]PAC32806.1 aminopeptidase [Flectobacillus sp. BAB-3569]